MTDRPDHAEQPPPSPPRSQALDSHAEQVLSQALRAMVGGDKPTEKTSAEKIDAEKINTAAISGSGPPVTGSRRRLTTGQLLLLAAIVGLLIGIAAGLGSLLL